MTEFVFTGPDGRDHVVEGPEGSTPQQAFAAFQKGWGGQGGGKPAQETGTTFADSADAFVRGAANALTFGFADRLAAGAGAATGIGGKSGDYEGNLAAQRALDKANLEEHPWESGAGEVAGGLMLPMGAAARSPTIAGRMAAGAGVGGVQGGLMGVGSSPDLTNTPEVAKNAGLGFGTGVVLGGAAPPVMEGLSLGAQALARKSGIPQAIAGLRDPKAVAEKMYGESVARDRAVGGAPLSQDAFEEAVRRGQPMVAGDLGGAGTQNLARAAANASPEAEIALKKTLNERYEAQSNRVANLVQDLGGGNSVETLDKLKQAASRANRPLYKKAYEAGSNGIWDDSLAQLSQAPVVQDAIRKTMVSAKNDAAKMGFAPPKNPFTTAPDGRVILKEGEGREIPNLQFWDYVKRNLDKAGKSGNADARDWARVLREHLDDVHPEYGEARGMAARAFGAEDALEAGAKFLTATGKNNEYAKTIAKMSDPERKLFAHGFMSELETKVREIPYRQDVVKKIFNSEEARRRVEMAVGEKKAGELEKYLYGEGIMQRLNEAVAGNSTTAKQLQYLKEMGQGSLIGGATYLGSGGDMKDASLGAVAGALAKRGSHAVNARVMQHVGELLASSDPAKIDRAISMAARSKGIQAYLRPFAPNVAAGAIAADAQRRKADQPPPVPTQRPVLTVTRRAGEENARQ
jgi:hypothetical protein